MVTWVYLLFVQCLAKIYVYSPDGLRREVFDEHRSYEIPSSLANFGNPPYGTVLTGRVFQPKLEQRSACMRLDFIDYSQGDPDMMITPILLVERGGCSFALKVRNAQDSGASAVIVADNEGVDINTVIMIDDGSGGNIFIPSFIISKADGATLREFIDLGVSPDQEAVLTLTFEMKRPDDRVEYQIWTSSDNELGRRFIHDFASTGAKFDDSNALFTPHFVLWYCVPCKENGYNAPVPDCVSNGRYCAPDPDNDNPLTGRDVVMEDLRQLCVYQETLNKNDESLWWRYMRYHYELCPLRNYGEECSVKAMKKAGVDSDKVLRCVDDSFNRGDPATADNSLLQQEHSDLIHSGIAFYPTIVINDQVYRGDFESDSVFDAICAGFRSGPGVCDKLSPKDSSDSEGLSDALIVFLILAGACALLVAVLVGYRLWLKRELNREMKMQVNSAVSQYIALSESRR